MVEASNCDQEAGGVTRTRQPTAVFITSRFGPSPSASIGLIMSGVLGAHLEIPNHTAQMRHLVLEPATDRDMLLELCICACGLCQQNLLDLIEGNAQLGNVAADPIGNAGYDARDRVTLGRAIGWRRQRLCGRHLCFQRSLDITLELTERDRLGAWIADRIAARYCLDLYLCHGC